MHIVMLVQPQHMPVPDNVTVVQNYGPETIMVDDNFNNRVEGQSMLLSGDESAFIEWLKPFDGVWQCGSPMIGDWQVFHIKEELIGDKGS